MMSNATAAPSPLHVRNICLCLATQRAARVLARRFDQAFRPLGITNNQFSLLNALSAPVPLRMAQLSAMLAMDRTTLTAALKALEKRGLAAATSDTRDRRIRRLQLTDEGRAILAAALPIWCIEHQTLDIDLGKADIGSLRRLLTMVAPYPAIPPSNNHGASDEQPCPE